MNYIRSQISKSDSPVIACYHTYRRKDGASTAYAGGELIPSGSLFLEFYKWVPHELHHEVFDHYHLLVDRAIPYWEGAYVVSVTLATGCNPLRLAQDLQKLTFKHRGKQHVLLDYADPLFHRNRSRRAIPRDTIFPYQWHLRNDGLFGGRTGVDIGAPEAWDITRGHPKVRVAVIDDAFDLTTRGFEEGRVIAPLNVHDGSRDVAPARNADEWHGTAVLGLISASHDGQGVCGIAPECQVIPIKLEPLLDDDAEARAFDHAVANGAAVINCSWGPFDDYTPNPWPMPRLTELAIENAYRNRVAVVFAAGNGSENMITDGYAAHPCVIAVAASTDRDERATYSDYGERVWVCAPSDGGASGIVTTDVRDGGYNVFGDLNRDFGGTSAAAPIVAGVIALMQSAFLAENPKLDPVKDRLTVEEIRAILRMTAKPVTGGATPFRDYWNHELLIHPAPRNSERHSLAFGYGRVSAPDCVRKAKTWKRDADADRKLAGLQKDAAAVRREPKITKRLRVGPPRGVKIKTQLPKREIGDPLSIFHSRREEHFDREVKSRFNSGEHVWLGTQGFREALGNEFPDYATIPRGDDGSRDRFSYGEIVALSGDFYRTPGELFYEKPTMLSWLWEKNDTSDLFEYFKKEIEAIKKQMQGVDVPYPDYNLEFWWNAKNYAELAKRNVSHFGWHNMLVYCRYHRWALDLAVRAYQNKDEDVWRKSLYFNGFADHFLTDGFAAGHIRIPRREIIDWGTQNDLTDTTSGFLSKILHDQDGHRNTDHGDGENRAEKDGLHVRNSLGDEWWTRCDGQLFSESHKESLHLRQPIEAVRKSVEELLTARRKGKLPKGVFAAIEHVPFPHPDEVALTKKFNPRATDKIRKWVKDANWYQFGVKENNVRSLFADLPELMDRFRSSVTWDAANPKLAKEVRRLPAAYVSAFRTIA